ncbi:hypothetical protein BN871_KF_00080 [Paenibacillus sp. P22]|nr:hypothetical protein BN871_KF_00080 [Paenibacillus sp. P22]
MLLAQLSLPRLHCRFRLGRRLTALALIALAQLLLALAKRRLGSGCRLAMPALKLQPQLRLAFLHSRFRSGRRFCEKRLMALLQLRRLAAPIGLPAGKRAVHLRSHTRAQLLQLALLALALGEQLLLQSAHLLAIQLLARRQLLLMLLLQSLPLLLALAALRFVQLFKLGALHGARIRLAVVQLLQLRDFLLQGAFEAPHLGGEPGFPLLDLCGVSLVELASLLLEASRSCCPLAFQQFLELSPGLLKLRLKKLALALQAFLQRRAFRRIPARRLLQRRSVRLFALLGLLLVHPLPFLALRLQQACRFAAFALMLPLALLDLAAMRPYELLALSQPTPLKPGGGLGAFALQAQRLFLDGGLYGSEPFLRFAAHCPLGFFPFAQQLIEARPGLLLAPLHLLLHALDRSLGLLKLSDKRFAQALLFLQQVAVAAQPEHILRHMHRRQHSQPRHVQSRIAFRQLMHVLVDESRHPADIVDAGVACEFILMSVYIHRYFQAIGFLQGGILPLLYGCAPDGCQRRRNAPEEQELLSSAVRGIGASLYIKAR